MSTIGPRWVLICLAAMLKQFIITLVVAAIVVVVARAKRKRNDSRSDASGEKSLRGSGSPSATVIVGYSLAAVMILATVGVTWLRYQEAREIVRIEVVDARSGDRTVYQVRRKELGERQFTTVDGTVVSLGASDRVERIE